MNFKKIFKITTTLFLATAISLSLSGEMKAAKKRQTKNVSPSNIQVNNFEITVGETGLFLSDVKGNLDTKTKHYVSFLPKNTKSLNFTVKSSHPDVVSIQKISNKKYRFKGLKQGTSKLTFMTSAKNKKGKKLKTNISVSVKTKTKFTAIQSGENSFTMHFNSKYTDNILLKDIFVENSTGRITPTSLLLSPDKKTVNVILSHKLQEGEKYIVRFDSYVSSFSASDEYTPSSIEIITKEAQAEISTPLNFKVFNKNGKEITDLLDLSKFNITIQANNAHFDVENRHITFKNSVSNADIKISYIKADGQEIMAVGTIKALKSEKEKEAEQLAAFYYYYYDNRSTLLSASLAYSEDHQTQITSEIVTLKFNKKIEEKNKKDYQNILNYRFEYDNKFSSEHKIIDSASLVNDANNFKIKDDTVTITLVLKEDAGDGVIPQGNIKLSVSTVGNLPRSQASFEKDFRKTMTGTPTIFTTSDLRFENSNDKTITLLFRDQIEFLGEAKLTDEIPAEVTLSDDKKKLTFTFKTNKDLSKLKDESTKLFSSLGSVRVIKQESQYAKINQGLEHSLQFEINDNERKFTEFRVHLTKID